MIEDDRRRQTIADSKQQTADGIRLFCRLFFCDWDSEFFSCLRFAVEILFAVAILAILAAFTVEIHDFHMIFTTFVIFSDFCYSCDFRGN